MSVAQTAGYVAPRHRSRSRWPIYAFLPITVMDFVLFVLPMLIMGIASVLVIHEFHVEYRLTANNYLFFLGSPLYLSILGKSVLIAAVVTLACLVIAFPFAYYLTLLPRHVQRIMLILVILPFWTSYLLRVYAWMTILGERGLINRALLGLGILDEPVRFLLYNNYAVVLVSVYLYIPYCVLALYTAIERLDTSLFSAAMDLGARPRQVFLHIMLPLTLPGVFASFIFVFIPMVGEYVTPTLVGGARGMMIVNIVVSQFQALRFGIGSAMVFVITALALCMVLALRRMARLEKVFGV
ncbi:MAG TPA: ABC transporter permease [Acetobacteraceae bacterium]|jgi:spermidine/putrescine transport system permease protein